MRVRLHPDAALEIGYIDKQGRIVIEARFDDGLELSGGLAPVLRRGRWGYIDRRGRVVLPFKYSNARPFRHGLVQVAINSVWRYIDRRGNTIWAPRKLEASGKALTTRVIARGHNSRARKRKFVVVRSRKTLERLWRQIWRGKYPGRYRRGPPLPRVDFQRNVALAVFQGRMGSTSSGIRITRVVESNDKVYVFVEVARPMSACLQYTMITSHWYIGETAKSTKPYTFVVKVVDACGARKH